MFVSNKDDDQSCYSITNKKMKYPFQPGIGLKWKFSSLNVHGLHVTNVSDSIRLRIYPLSLSCTHSTLNCKLAGKQTKHKVPRRPLSKKC